MIHFPVPFFIIALGLLEETVQNTENPLDNSQAVQWDSCMKNWDTWQLSVRVNEFSSSPAC